MIEVIVYCDDCGEELSRRPTQPRATTAAFNTGARQIADKMVCVECLEYRRTP